MAKKVPLRQCLGCREMKPKSALLRVVKSAQGEISLDPGGKMPGRGAYLCHEPGCFLKIRKTRGLERSFSMAIAPELYDTLETSLQTIEEEGENE